MDLFKTWSLLTYLESTRGIYLVLLNYSWSFRFVSLHFCKENVIYTVISTLELIYWQLHAFKVRSLFAYSWDFEEVFFSLWLIDNDIFFFLKTRRFQWVGLRPASKRILTGRGNKLIMFAEDWIFHDKYPICSYISSNIPPYNLFSFHPVLHAGIYSRFLTFIGNR